MSFQSRKIALLQAMRPAASKQATPKTATRPERNERHTRLSERLALADEEDSFDQIKARNGANKRRKTDDQETGVLYTAPAEA